ncbi:MAG TPA: hypothetical protein VF177_07820 [Anaerolineae bacterium]
MRASIQLLARSPGTRHGLVMAGATVIAGGFDYLVLVLAVSLLGPAESIVYLAVMALLQVMVHATNVIRNVVAYYTAELTVQPQATGRIGAFLQRGWRWAWRWGLIATAIMALLSPLLTQWLRIDSLWPLLAGSLALLLLFLRPVTDGALQGIQHFVGLGTVQVVQAFLRLVLTVTLIWLGLRSPGAIVSLPLASSGALLLALWLLRPYFLGATDEVQAVSWRYSVYTLVGLLAFALLVNVDAVMVKRFFSDDVAGNYSPIITLGKMNLFIPLGIGLVLFPKATQRQASGRDARPVLLLALAVTLLPGLLLTFLYFLAPGFLVHTIFTDVYADPGIVLGLVGLATTLFAGVNIWLNYALSLALRPFIYALTAVVFFQIVAILLFHDNFYQIALILVAAGLAGNGAGVLTALGQQPTVNSQQSTTNS